MIRPNSQNARILRALAKGKWVTAAEIHRRAGACRLNSRVSELRKRGYTIEREAVPGKSGSLGHRYRLVGGLAQTELALLENPAKLVGLPRKEVPRSPDLRFRIYRQLYDEIDLVATAATPEEVGIAIIALGSEGTFEHSCVGILDTHGTDARPGSWIINPWDTSP